MILGLIVAIGLAIVPLRATELGASIPLTAPGTFATATLAGQAVNAFVTVSIQSPGAGNIGVDIFESTDGGQTWVSYESFGCEGGVYPPNNLGFPVGANSVCTVGMRLLVNTATTLFRADVRSISGGTWTIISASETS